MPLSRAQEEKLTTVNGVKFLMKDTEEVEVSCRASLDLLAVRFDSGDTSDEYEQTFLVHRGASEQAASAKFDQGDIEPRVDPKVVITARDMASPLSRKF